MRGLAWALGGVAFGLGIGLGARRTRSSAAAIDSLEHEFHAAYDRLRTDNARAAPVLILFQGSLVLMHGAERREFLASHPATRVIQAAAHAPVGIFAVLHELAPDAQLGPAAQLRLGELRAACARAGAALESLEAHAREAVERVLLRSREFVADALTGGRADPHALARFARESGPELLALVEHATRLELTALDAAATQALSSLSRAALRELEVVVAGAHQARARSLGLQYFQKRFGEAPGEERRVSYAEAAGDLEQARSLVGTRRLDRAIAGSFFGDPKRLQRDVLGDAAQRALDVLELEALAAQPE